MFSFHVVLAFTILPSIMAIPKDSMKNVSSSKAINENLQSQNLSMKAISTAPIIRQLMNDMEELCLCVNVTINKTSDTKSCTLGDVSNRKYTIPLEKACKILQKLNGEGDKEDLNEEVKSRNVGVQQNKRLDRSNIENGSVVLINIQTEKPDHEKAKITLEEVDKITPNGTLNDSKTNSKQEKVDKIIANATLNNNKTNSRQEEVDIITRNGILKNEKSNSKQEEVDKITPNGTLNDSKTNSKQEEVDKIITNATLNNNKTNSRQEGVDIITRNGTLKNEKSNSKQEEVDKIIPNGTLNNNETISKQEEADKITPNGILNNNKTNSKQEETDKITPNGTLKNDIAKPEHEDKNETESATNEAQTISDEQRRHTTTVLVLTIMSCLVIGAILGVAATVFYRRYQKKSYGTRGNA